MIESTHIRVSRAVQEALLRKSQEVSTQKSRRVTITEVIEMALASLEKETTRD